MPARLLLSHSLNANVTSQEATAKLWTGNFALYLYPSLSLPCLSALLTRCVNITCLLVHHHIAQTQQQQQCYVVHRHTVS